MDIVQINNSATEIQIAYTPQPMRGIRQAIAEIKKTDPYTALTERGLRNLIKSGEIPCVRIGRKVLINMNVLTRYMLNGTAAEKPLQAQKIRVIPE